MPSTTNVKEGPNDASNRKATTADDNGTKTAVDGIKAADSGRYIFFFVLVLLIGLWLLFCVASHIVMLFQLF